MGELITIFIGQAGLQLGSECWEFFMKKYGVTPDGSADQENPDLEKANLIFQELDKGIYKPRAVLIDLEPTVIDQVKKGKLKDLFDHNSFISSKECSSDNFYRAYYTQASQIIDEAMDKIRKLITNCSSCQGFLIFHSISGGTGSAIACKLSEYLKIDYKKKLTMSYTIYPSKNMSNSVMEMYNAVTAVSLMEFFDISIVFNNEALYNICDQHLDIESVQYSHINQMIANMATANLEQKLNNDSTFYLDSLTNNLVPFPRLKFMLQSYSAFISPQNNDYSTIAQITNNAFKKNYFLSDCDPSLGQHISCALLYQGDPDMLSIFSAVNNLQYQPYVQFTIDDQAKLKINIHNQTVKIPSNCQFKQNKRSLSMIANSTAFSQSIKHLAAKFDSLYVKRAFVHWYVAEGMEEFQLSHSREFLADLINDYRNVSSNEDQLSEDE